MERLSDEIINKYIAEMRVVVDAHKCDAMYRDNMLALIELKQYRDTGLTPQRIRELKERDTAMEINEIHVDEYYCPACGAENNCDQGVVEDYFCPRCGQRLKEREN